MSNEPLGALLAVIGKSRNLILIGRGAKFIATQEGVLMLGINQGLGRQMDGSYSVMIEVRRP